MLANPTAPEITPSPGERAAFPDVLDPGYLDALLAANHTFQEAPSPAPELTFEELLDQKVKEKIKGVEQYAKDLAAQEQAAEQDPEPITLTPEPVEEERREKPRGFRKVARGVGILAMAGGLGVIGVFGGMFGKQVFFPHEAEATEISATSSRDTQASITTSTTEATTTTVEATTTTVPEAVPFTAKAGEKIGFMSIPGICEDTIDVYAQSENDKVQDADGDWGFRPEAPINKRDPDVTPRGDCAQTAEYASHQPGGYLQRNQRNNKASNKGNAAQWQPVAIHEMNDNGILSVYPGEAGNTVFASHRTTYSATFGDIGALKPGDPVYFVRSDKKGLTYRVVGQEVLPADAVDEIYNWSHPDSEATMTLYGCSNADGSPGGASHRIVIRAVME
jgi:sortase (surface protein transpeptidase)